jgi:hypothetical protein
MEKVGEYEVLKLKFGPQSKVVEKPAVITPCPMKGRRAHARGHLHFVKQGS